MVPWPGILWCAWSRERHTLPYNNNTLFISFLTPVDNSFLTLKYDKTIWKRILDHCKTKETCPQISQSRKMFFSIKVMRFFVLCSTVEVLWCFGSVWLEELIMVQEQWQIWTLPWVLLQKPNCKMQCVAQKGRHLPRREYGNYFLRCRVKRWPVKAACKVYTPTEHRNDIIRCLNSDKVKTRV